MRICKYMVLALMVVLGGLALAQDPPQDPPPAPEIFWVDDDQTGQGNGSINNPFATIQEGIDEAGAGDFVRVKDGTYNENIDIGKAITVRSDQGADDCTIVGDQTTSVVHVWTDGAVLKGFGITNGVGKAVTPYGITYYCGAGVFLGESESTVKECVIYDCDATHFGGGIFVGYEGETDFLADPPYAEIDFLITNNVIYNCTAYEGGGIYAEWSAGDALISWNEIYQCEAGGGMAIEVRWSFSGFTISHNFIHDNGGENDLYCVWLHRQEAWEYPPTNRTINFYNNIVMDNLGYGVACEHSGYTRILYCTIVNNDFGGILSRGSTESHWSEECWGTCINTILYDNGEELYDLQAEIRSYSTFNFSDCCFMDEEEGIGTYSGGTYTYASSCFDNDPELDSYGRIQNSNNPCIDMGGTWAEVTRDIDGDARIIDTYLDIGADEYNDN